MPSKKKKYNARFPAGRIKKIMQSDEEVGKVAQAVPVIISRTLELFVESLLMKTLKITYCRNAKTLSPSHMKQCIMSESRFDFLRELVKNIPDISMAEESLQDNSPSQQIDNIEREQPYDFRMPSTSCETNATPLPKNGGNSLMKNGIQMKFSDASTTITSSCSTSTTDQHNQNIHLKRHWESTQGRTMDNKKSNILRTLSDTYERTQTVPTKLMRMDSAPTAAPESNKSSKIRLMHQPKSVPCTSKEASTSYQQPVIPAPIIDIMDICNKPIVKIDYSNLVLPDKESSSGSSPDQNPMNTYISPVINIDLSKIGAQPNCDLQTVSMSASSVKSTLELDEDYDNI